MQKPLVAGQPASTLLRPRKKSAVRNAPDLVFEAPSGELFLQGDSNGSMEQHRGELVFPEDRILEWCDDIVMRQQTAHSIGAEFRFLVGPDKQSVYWSEISTTRPDHRNVFSILKKLSPEVTYIDPVPALIETARTRRVFPRTDTHWDMSGAYIGYRELMTSSLTQGPALLREGVDFDFREIISPGDLGMKQMPPTTSAATRIRAKKMRSKMIYRNGLTFNGIVRVYRKPAKEGMGIVFGDSYSQTLIPYIAEHFGLCLHVRGSHFDAELVKRIRPDVVISEVAERYMIRPPILRTNEPTELLFIQRLQSGEMTEKIWDKTHSALVDRNLPPAFLALIDRQEALAETLRADAQEPQAYGQKFCGEVFVDAAPADVIVAAYLGRRYGRPMPASWRSAYEALPSATRDSLAKVCGGAVL